MGREGGRRRRRTIKRERRRRLRRRERWMREYYVADAEEAKGDQRCIVSAAAEAVDRWGGVWGWGGWMDGRVGVLGGFEPSSSRSSPFIVPLRLQSTHPSPGNFASMERTLAHFLPPQPVHSAHHAGSNPSRPSLLRCHRHRDPCPCDDVKPVRSLYLPQSLPSNL